MIKQRASSKGHAIPAESWIWLNEDVLDWTDGLPNGCHRSIGNGWRIHKFLSKVEHIDSNMEQEQHTSETVSGEHSTEDSEETGELLGVSGHTTEEPDEQHDPEDGQPEVESGEDEGSSDERTLLPLSEAIDNIIEYIEVEYV